MVVQRISEIETASTATRDVRHWEFKTRSLIVNFRRAYRAVADEARPSFVAGTFY